MRSVVLILSSAVIFSGCTGGGQGGRGVLVGSTPVAGGTISAFELDYPDDGPIGGATTDANGQYRAEVHGALGDLLVCVAGGFYRDIATSTDGDMGSAELCALTLDVRAEAEEIVLHITPATHLAYSRARYLSKALGISIGSAYRLSMADVDAWSGRDVGGMANTSAFDFTQALQTADLASSGTGVLSQPLSQQVDLICEARGVAPAFAHFNEAP